MLHCTQPECPAEESMKPVNRPKKALLLTVIYLLIIMAPLAVGAMSGSINPTITTCPCSCEICECSPSAGPGHICCGSRDSEGDGHQHEDAAGDQPGDQKPRLSCGNRCMGETGLFFSSTGKTEVLPYFFAAMLPDFHRQGFNASTRCDGADRQDDPPDPPPKISLPI